MHVFIAATAAIHSVFNRACNENQAQLLRRAPQSVRACVKKGGGLAGRAGEVRAVEGSGRQRACMRMWMDGIILDGGC